MEFQRFTAADAVAHEAAIAEHRAMLASALQAGNELAQVDCTADLAGLLTTARREAEALALLEAQLGRIERFSASEVSGWFWNAYATALQYNGRRDDANPAFARALALSRAGGWRRLQAFVLQHWGRSLVEQGSLDEAQLKFEEALAIRQQLSDPRTATTEKALAGLAGLRAGTAGI
ncbi:tetratricopeptide repeat protein [Roseateles sp. LYH14W]|uniref:Tetratricopeptide repeat protein n=1 Tax=Pelomonas parva TaxID=3299032 RepID=A0ABW7F0G5_9BURK